MKKFLKENIFILLYFAIVTIIELLAVFVTSGKFYIKEPWIFLLVQFVFVSILLCLPSQKTRFIVAACFIALFLITNLAFIIIFEMTETIFDFGMFKLRKDAMGILESIPINFLYFSISALMLSCFIIFGGRFARNNNQKFGSKYLKIVASLTIVLSLTANIFVLYFGNKNLKTDIYEKLYKTNDASYNKFGTTGHFVNEMFKGSFMSAVKLGDEKEIENYIYKDVTETNFEALKKDYNVVTILVESFEWTSFVEDFELYSKGYNLTNPETGEQFEETAANEALSQLFPNIYDFYKSSIALTNFHSREKTDIAENFSLIGSYPTNAYINYDFPDNTFSTSLASILKNMTGGNISCTAFHNGTYEYYNRNKELISVGFDKFYASEQMYDMGMPNHLKSGDRNLDSEMIETCKDLMFPTDKRFYTHITTITMHGQYGYRSNLAEQGYYDELKKYGIVLEEQDENSNAVNGHNSFVNYVACVKEFDKALGKIMTDLKEKELDKNTIVLLYGDHNTYYSSLSNFVKDIDSTSDDNYTNLFRVPCLIYHPDFDKLVNLVKLNQSFELNSKYVITTYKNSKGESVYNLQVKKFTCTADIVPTLFDLMGLNYYSNLYFGNSAFSDEVSVLYSRAYNVFITDSLYFSNINDIKYQRKAGDTKENQLAAKYANLKDYSEQAHLEATEAAARKLLEKLSFCNRIFYNDYFARKNINDSSLTNAEVFAAKMLNINSNVTLS